jgi:hypothetical protein
MPSMLHDALVTLFSNRLSLAPELLREVLHVDIPSFAGIGLESAALTEVTPAEYRADLVLTLLVDGVAVFAIVLEVQLAPDEDKPFTWPAYLAGFRKRLRCPVVLLVVCPDRDVARWCSQPIPMGHPGWTIVPIVLGPDAVPVITEPGVARRAPELAVLSAIAHARFEGGAEVARAAIEAAGGLDEDKARFYTDLVMMVLPEAARSALEATMSAGNWEYQSEFVKRWVREVKEARELGEAIGKAEGEAIGKAEGEAIGKAEGEAIGKANALLELLQARGLEISDEQRERITRCRELALLSTWIKRAASAVSAADVFC